MKRIFVDMDGVLADFDSKYKQLYGHYPKDGFSKTKWKRFCTTAQFAGLDLFPGAETLIQYLNKLDALPSVSVMILGSTGGYDFHHTVQTQKIFWLKDKGINFQPIFVPGKRFKRFHATDSSMLVDDHEMNVKQFIEHGGHAHQYLTPEPAIVAIEKFICN